VSMAQSNSWRRVARSAHARGGPRRRDGIVLARAATVFALLGAVSWLGWTLVRPLPQPLAGQLPTLAATSQREQQSVEMESRHAAVNALSGDNIFAHDRRFWERAVIVPETDAASGEASPKQAGAKSREKTTNAKESAEESRKVAELFALRQIYTRRDGQLVARLSLLKSPDPENTIALVESDEFKESPNSDTMWTLSSIDRVANTVTIERGNQSATLSLFSGSVRPLEAPSNIAAVPVIASVEPEVQLRSRDEIISELRAANVADADIAAIVAMLEAKAELAKPTVPAPPSATATPGARTPPPGLEGVLRLMGQQQMKAAGAKPAEVDASSKAE